MYHWHLVKEMAERQIATKYKGSALGWFWTILTPLLMLTVYMFVFSVVFQRRWETAIGDEEISRSFFFPVSSAMAFWPSCCLVRRG